MAQRHSGAHREVSGEEDFVDWFESWELESGSETGGRSGASRHARPATQEGHDEGRLVAFAREYGWRAYAVPVLAVITVFVLINMVQHPADTVIDTAATASMSDEAPAPGETDELQPAVIAEGQFNPEDLPPGGPYTTAGEGTFYEVGVPGAAAGEGTEKVVRYVVEVERGVDTAGYGGDHAFSTLIDATLMDPRGWINDPRFRFEHVTAADDPTLRIRLTSLDTTAKLCGAMLGTETSCRTTVTGEDTVLINESRWVRGAVPFQGDLGSYRQYVINHETGHALGFSEHVPCPEPGVLAPIMMQQTLSLNNRQIREMNPDDAYPDNDDTCRPNPWPYPRPAVL